MTAATQRLLRVEGLHTWFAIRGGLLQRPRGYVRAVDGVDLEVAAGHTVALVGESGSGKTTVGRSILRLEEPRAGRVLFEGVDLLGLRRAELRAYRRSMQIIFQDPLASLDPRLRVGDAVAEGIRAFRLADGAAECEERVVTQLRRVGLEAEHMDRYPHEFSGGQRQRICIARALAVEPRLLICDESLSALDVSIQAQILNLLRELQDDLGLAYLFITHDLGVVRYLAHRVSVMYLGQIVEEGPTERLFAEPAHPYTRALLAAIPSVDPARRGGAPTLRGDMPSPAAPPAGCRFHTRCPEVLARCAGERPTLYPLADGAGASRCFLSETAAKPAGDSGGARGTDPRR